MPVCVGKKDGKWRVIECATGDVAKNAAGTPMDGGGSADRARVARQVAAVNIAKHERSKNG